MDLDGFKAVNDTYGHATGDAVLREVASRLTAAMRPGDLVARLGGDEFAVLCTSVTDGPASLSVGRRIVAVLERPVVVDGRPHHIGASVGAQTTRSGRGGIQVMSDADTAMYTAKRSGGRRAVLHFGDPERARSRRGRGRLPC